MGAARRVRNHSYETVFIATEPPLPRPDTYCKRNCGSLVAHDSWWLIVKLFVLKNTKYTECKKIPVKIRRVLPKGWKKSAERVEEDRNRGVGCQGRKSRT